MEAILLDTMFELPALKGVEEVVIGPEVVGRRRASAAHLLRPRRRKGLERLGLQEAVAREVRIASHALWINSPCSGS